LHLTKTVGYGGGGEKTAAAMAAGVKQVPSAKT